MPESFLKRALSGFTPYTPGLQPPDGEGWIKLNTNESPWPPSPKVLAALHAAIGENLRLYPSPLAEPAREAIAREFGLTPDWVAMGNGGDELIAMCLRAFVGAGERVAFPTPSYPLYEPEALMYELTPIAHPLGEGWALPDSLAADEAPLKLVANPNSPTGTWYPRPVIEDLVRRSRGVVALDEAYVDFAPETRLDLLHEHANLLLLRTLSKSGALAGLRIGYALGHPDLIRALDVVKDSYNLDRLAIVAAVAAIEDRDYRRRLVEHVVNERDWLAESLAGAGFTVAPSAANFVFVRPPAPAGEVFEGLKARKVLVRHYDREPIAGWFRITVGTREQHERLLSALQEVMA